jgi:hypothetical protein
MDFRFHLLGLLLLAAPLIMFCVIYGICKKMGDLAGRKTVLPAATKPRPAYFHPTRELDGNDT